MESFVVVLEGYISIWLIGVKQQSLTHLKFMQVSLVKMYLTNLKLKDMNN